MVTKMAKSVYKKKNILPSYDVLYFINRKTCVVLIILAFQFEKISILRAIVDLKITIN